MKSKFSKALSLLLVVLMVLSVTPAVLIDGIFTLRVSAETYSGTCGDNLTWTLDTAIGELIISGNGTMTEYKSPSDVPWNIYKYNIKSAIIGNGVTSIGKYAFSSFINLTSVTIPGSVISIGEDAFYYCPNLSSVYISDIAIWCNISFGDAYANPLYYAENFYLNDKLITELVIPDGVTEISGNAFYNYSRLTSVIVPDSVTKIGEFAFGKCESLTSITIGCGVTSIGSYAFHDCKKLSSVYTSDIAIWCGISFGNEYANPLYYAENLYLNDTLITDLVIPDGVTSIGNYAFYNCSSLKSVTVPKSVTSVGKYALGYLNGLKISNFKIYCYEGTAGEQYAKAKGFSYELLEDMRSGDINGDGEVDSADATSALKYDAGMLDLDETALNAADVNGDGEVDSADATMILKYDAGMIDEF